MQQSLAVFRQNPALLYQIVHRFCVAADVIFPTGIPFSDGLARSTQLPTLGGTLGTWEIGPFERHALVGSPDPRFAEIPTGVGCQRTCNPRHTDARPVLSI